MNAHERVRVQLAHAAGKLHRAILDVEDADGSVLDEVDRVRLRATFKRTVALHQIVGNRLNGVEPTVLDDVDLEDLEVRDPGELLEATQGGSP